MTVAMPYMLDQAGTICGFIMFIASMALTQLSIARVLDVAATLQHRRKSASARTPLVAAAAGTEAADELVRTNTAASLVAKFEQLGRL